MLRSAPSLSGLPLALVVAVGLGMSPGAASAQAASARPHTAPSQSRAAASLRAMGGAGPSGWRAGSQVAELRGYGTGSELGRSVAVSADGSVALMSADLYGGAGAVFVFADRAGDWSQVAELTPDQPADGEAFGYSVSLSADGSTALVGAAYLGSGVGAAYVFRSEAGSWQQVAMLTPPSGVGAEAFGSAVSLAADGSTAAIGAFASNDDDGAAFVFSDAGGTWQATATMQPPAGVGSLPRQRGRAVERRPHRPDRRRRLRVLRPGGVRVHRLVRVVARVGAAQRS
jgi:hypothetical protein